LARAAAGYTQPATESHVTVSVGSTSWMPTGDVLLVTPGTLVHISALPDATTVVLTNLGYAGNASSGTVVASNKTVSAGGLIGLKIGRASCRDTESLGAVGGLGQGGAEGDRRVVRCKAMIVACGPELTTVLS